MKAAWGEQMARKIAQRLSEMQRAISLAELALLPAARCHEPKGDRKGQLSVDLTHPFRMLFVAAHDPLPLKEDGGLDWSGVTAVEIVGIDDTH